MRHYCGTDNSNCYIQCRIIWYIVNKPVTTSLNCGLTKIISIRNEIPMTAISAMIKLPFYECQDAAGIKKKCIKHSN